MQLTQTPPATWEKGYNNYGPYLKNKYPGQRVFKVIVDGGFTCPNRDGSKGYGGCTYCNVDSFTPSPSRQNPGIREQVIAGVERRVPRCRPGKRASRDSRQRIPASACSSGQPISHIVNCARSQSRCRAKSIRRARLNEPHWTAERGPPYTHHAPALGAESILLGSAYRSPTVIM